MLLLYSIRFVCGVHCIGGCCTDLPPYRLSVAIPDGTYEGFTQQFRFIRSNGRRGRPLLLIGRLYGSGAP